MRAQRTMQPTWSHTGGSWPPPCKTITQHWEPDMDLKAESALRKLQTQRLTTKQNKNNRKTERKKRQWVRKREMTNGTVQLGGVWLDLFVFQTTGRSPITEYRQIMISGWLITASPLGSGRSKIWSYTIINRTNKGYVNCTLRHCDLTAWLKSAHTLHCRF